MTPFARIARAIRQALQREDDMREHIHVPADFEDHIHQPAWNEPSRNAGHDPK